MRMSLGYLVFVLLSGLSLKSICHGRFYDSNTKIKAGLRAVKVYVPESVKQSETVTLRCWFDLNGDSLYSVKWYKGGREIFRYLPRETVSIKIFPLDHLHVIGIRRLYPHNFDRRRELKKLNHSLLVNFLDLLDLLVRCPESPKRTEKVEDLSLLFIHIHHLLNEFRPHQARETLRVMMDLQKRQRIEIAQRFQKHLDKVIEMLQQAIHTLPDTSDFDSKLMVPTEAFESMDQFNQSENGGDASVLDEMMCNIVDQL